ncbi:uncharacterized protein LOC143211602 [Lasioglossum baleicum]|uniref:uncharacterized protein LOC143211602 n=1 Tax=Lasioglossum baleicum TaxID=434251 RepID=UPI003FCC3FF4
MEELLIKQNRILHSINRALTNFKKLGQAKMTIATTTNRITVLKEAFNQAQDLNARIAAMVDDETEATLPYFQEDHFERCEERYLEALDFMSEMLVTNTPSTSTNQIVSTQSHGPSRLPRIYLPSFDGTFAKWESFRDRFKSLVINDKSLSDVERLHYLASALKGDAIDLIANLPITDQNFHVAWQLFHTRFEKPRRLIMTHLTELFSLPTVTTKSPKELQKLRDRIHMSTKALRNLGRPVDMWSDIIVYLGVQRLDRSSRKAWELKLKNVREFPTFNDFDEFLDERINQLESMVPEISETSTDNGKVKPSKQKTISTHSTTVVNLTCPVCKQSHLLYQCKPFLAKSPSERFEIVKSNKRCVNCFSIKHMATHCQSKHSCKECNQRHHTLLHFPSKSEQPSAAPTKREIPTSSEDDTEISSNLVSNIPTHYRVLLSTARVQVRSEQGRNIAVRALLDQGSVATLMTERVAQLLRLHRTKRHIRITGIGEAQSVAQHVAEIIITPERRDQPAYSTTAVILRSLTKYVPPKCKSWFNWTHISDVELADREPMSSDPIDLIIGADVYSQLILDGIRKGSPATPVAQNTTLGWILSGPIAPPEPTQSIDVHHSTVVIDLDRTLRKFWEIEEIPSHVTTTPDDEKCEQHFKATHSRQPDGRYVVRLPFKHSPPLELGDSRMAALRSLHRVERRLHSNPTHADMYRAFMLEYEALGHMRKVSQENTKSDPSRYYIPHHAVFRDSSATTRLRVVFNASCRTTTGQSLNDHLFNGPKLQGDLIAILLRWRQYRFVYTADIAKMYRQIRVDSQDVDYQRILWRNSPSDPVDEYQLLTVTYGTTSAPFQALRVMKQLSQDEGAKFPLAIPVLQHQTYVDDCLFGDDSRIRLNQIRDQLNAVLAAGCFRLRKWASNDPSMLSAIDPSDHGLATGKTLSAEDTVPILGISWNPAHDEFHFRISSQPAVPSTKRTILSTIARLFDPLGWVTPVIIKAKMLMQQLWAERCGWDDPIPDNLQKEWQEYSTQLPDLEAIRIPRKLASDPALTQTLHGFADASSKAYAAAVYVRSVLRDGTVWVTLLVAKSRVAPVKTVSIPRLELCAALLLARLMTFVQSSLHSRNYECHCWTDSSITLTWLNQSPSKWKTFVANRVSKIQTLLPDAQWHHVSTLDNPADCASRGVTPSKLRIHHIWWSGPSWLKQTSDKWPQISVKPNSLARTEARPVRIETLVSTTDQHDLALRFSSWSKLLRVTAYVLRFIERLRMNVTPSAIPAQERPASLVLSPDEIAKAKEHWLRQIQFDDFPHDRQTLVATGTVPKSSPLAALVPYIDAKGLIRATGRLSKSQLPESAKHPIILRSHPLLILLIKWTHLKHLHSGPQLTLACLRNDYWILRARATVRAVLHQCVACTRERALIPNELMGDLPASRITQVERAFIHTGVDYAGPIQVRTAPGRGHKSTKAYIALFICLTTKAIHLELVSDYSSSAFVAAYHRFVSRRGLPKSMSSDNGTTFQGAERELAAAYKSVIRNADFQNSLAVNGVAWHFLPPAAPHFGGLWEAAVKSVKHHLKRCIGAHTLTFEEMATFLCRVEACLNSRPLAQTSESIDDYTTLTPGHFLIGSALVAIPEPSVLNVTENRLSRWQLLQRLTEIFWKTWTTDYMQTLHQRPKWRVVQGLAKVGQIVLVRNPNNPPCKWELGRISACHPGDDGLVRVVTIRTAQSEYKRPITKLCFLPVAINEMSEPSVT